MSRCPECGKLERGVWTRTSILAAVAAFAAEHGRTPTQREWFNAGPFNPAVSGTRRVFGSWNAMIEASGHTPRPRGGRARAYSRDETVEALFRWVFEHGRVPTQKDWHTSDPGRPSRQQIVGLFGSWNGFLVAGGYEPRRPRRSKRSYLLSARSAVDGRFVPREQAC